MLVVQHFSYAKGVAYWCCLCLCGQVACIKGPYLKKGHTISCGCFVNRAGRTHGLSKTLLYKRWVMMIQRCTNPHDHAFHNYGGRGITVCERWRHSFVCFIEDMGEPPQEMQLERRDNNGPYSSENCYWATPQQQANNRRSNHILESHGLQYPIKEWSRITGIHRHTIHTRLKLGWTIEEALTTPVDKRRWHTSQSALKETPHD